VTLRVRGDERICIIVLGNEDSGQHASLTEFHLQDVLCGMILAWITTSLRICKKGVVSYLNAPFEHQPVGSEADFYSLYSTACKPV
jgi:hypothetical protein